MTSAAKAETAIEAALGAANISFDKNSYGYFSRVGSLSEKATGYPESGWMFSVNDSFENLGTKDTSLVANDRLELHYSIAGYGADVGSYWSGGPTVAKLTLGGVAATISNPNGAGTEASPYVIPVTLPAGTNLTSLPAAVESTLHPPLYQLWLRRGVDGYLRSGPITQTMLHFVYRPSADFIRHIIRLKRHQQYQPQWISPH